MRDLRQAVRDLRQAVRDLRIRRHSYVRVLGPRRGLVAAAVPSRVGVVSVSWEPSPHPIFVRPGTSDLATFNEVLLDGEYDFDLSRSPRTIIDAGANIGLTSIWYATRYPHARIFAIEAEASNFDLMSRNLAPFENVTLLHAALWSGRGVLAVHDPTGMGAWAFQTTESLDLSTDAFGTVESLTISDVMQRYGLDHIDLLKIDIEGAEREVFSLPSVERWISSVDAMAVELHDRFRAGCSRAFYKQVEGFPVEATRGNTVFVAR